MSDDHLSHLPQSPRPACDTNVIQLPSTDLTQVFRESLPRHPRLSPRQGHEAALMHRAGRDAAAIADRIEASLGSVLDFLDLLKKAHAKKAEEREVHEPEPAPTGPAYCEPLVAEAPRSEPAPAPPPKLPPPDVELNALQQAVIRRLRNSRISTQTIARMMRLSPDQVMRGAGEIP